MKESVGTVVFIDDEKIEEKGCLVRIRFAYNDFIQQENEFKKQCEEQGIIVLSKVHEIYDFSESEYEFSSGYTLNVFVPVKVSYKMMKETLECCKKLIENGDVKDIYLTNYHESSFGIDFDYYDYNQNRLRQSDSDQCEELNKQRDSFNVLNYYFKEKLEMLSDKEKEMFYHYRNFDLDHLLFSNDSCDYPLNNGNAGVISIFEDRIYCSTCTKMQHSAEIDKHLKLEGYEFEKSNILSDVSKTNSVQIQVAKKELIFWIPSYEKLSDYQRNQLKKFVLFCKKMLENKENDVWVHWGVISDMKLIDNEGLETLEHWFTENELSEEKSYKRF